MSGINIKDVKISFGGTELTKFDGEITVEPKNRCFSKKNKISETTKNILKSPYSYDEKWNLFSSRPVEIQEGQNDVFDLQDEFQKLVEPIKERIGEYIVQSLQERMRMFCNRDELEEMRGIRAPKDETENDKRPTLAVIISNESIQRFIDSVVGRVNYERPGYDPTTVYLQTDKELKTSGFIHDKKKRKLIRI